MIEVAAYRGCPSGRIADAMTLANILRVDAHLHRRLPADSELCQAIAC